jgi:hypothetical protein
LVTDLSLGKLAAFPASRDRVALSPVAALGVSAVGLGCGLQVNFGQYDPTALAYLGLAIVAGVVGLAGIARGEGSGRGVVPVLVAGLVVQFFVLICSNPMATLRVTSPGQLLVFRSGVLCAGVLAALALNGGRWGRVGWWLVLATHFLLGLWVLRAMPQPGVDVCLFQREAAEALSRGHNPYAMTFANLYPDAGRVYGAGTFAADRLLFGYPYPPLSLLLVLPGHLLGDFRLSHLVATTAAGGLIAAARPGRVATAGAALFLFTPRGFFVLEAGWTEPMAVMLLAVVVFVACRRRDSVGADPRVRPGPANGQGGHGGPPLQSPAKRALRWVEIWSLPVALGLLLVVKQYLILIAPLAVVLLPGSGRFRLRAVIATAAIVTLPLALWNLGPFVWSVCLLQFRQPMRADALSFLPLLAGVTRAPGAGVVPFVAAAGVAAWAGLRCPRTPGAFAAASAVMFLLFFALNKQAFCNYYFFVIGGLCCAIAAANPAERPSENELTI